MSIERKDQMAEIYKKFKEDERQKTLAVKMDDNYKRAVHRAQDELRNKSKTENC
jgi:hypothetical protein